MTAQEAIKILSAYNLWRNGEVAPYHPSVSEISQAIDRGIHALELEEVLGWRSVDSDKIERSAIAYTIKDREVLEWPTFIKSTQVIWKKCTISQCLIEPTPVPCRAFVEFSLFSDVKALGYTDNAKLARRIAEQIKNKDHVIFVLDMEDTQNFDLV